MRAARMHDNEVGCPSSEHAKDALIGVSETAAGTVADAMPGAPAGTLGTAGALRIRRLSGAAPVYTATST